jgi:hypothetical protein
MLYRETFNVYCKNHMEYVYCMGNMQDFLFLSPALYMVTTRHYKANLQRLKHLVEKLNIVWIWHKNLCSVSVALLQQIIYADQICNCCIITTVHAAVQLVMHWNVTMVHALSPAVQVLQYYNSAYMHSSWPDITVLQQLLQCVFESSWSCNALLLIQWWMHAFQLAKCCIFSVPIPLPPS